MDFLHKVVRRLTGVMGFLGSALVVLLILHVTLDVALRNIFNYPLTGTIEVVSLLYMIGICFLPLALTDERDAHISVEVLTELMPAGVVRWLIIAGTALAVLVMAMLCWRTWLEAMTQMRKGTVINVGAGDPVISWPSYFLLPLGFGLSTLICAFKLVCQLTNRPFGPDADDLPAGMELVSKEHIENV
ncbi:TRAP transporter small permease [Gemmobacter sp.]|uniref:TRAP transporter small permease n=1 Tax=Gemmobacter sp. TaxID=1898957 RepID=UPI002AFE458C|nr:TRAP transporter small permease [Gemmobacter sp.]